MRESIPRVGRIGRSVEGRDLTIHANFELGEIRPAAASTLIIGGMHGDEVATVLLLEDFIERHLGGEPLPTVVLPLSNPDGYERCSRYNARGVDLNRNCGFNWREDSLEPAGEAPWSEPEIRALRDFILRWQPQKIVSLHWALSEIDADGHHSTDLARAMWEALDEVDRRPYRLRVTEPEGGQKRLEKIYTACPGSLGQWCGYELVYPSGIAPAMVTLELPYDPAAEDRPGELPQDHLETLKAMWAQEAEQYLRAVEGPVLRMLQAACRFQKA